jgi:hypothetical protein
MWSVWTRCATASNFSYALNHKRENQAGKLICRLDLVHLSHQFIY